MKKIRTYSLIISFIVSICIIVVPVWATTISDIKKQEEACFASFSDNKPLKTQFENYYNAICQFFMNNPLYFRFMEQLSASPIITEESRQFGLQAVDALQILIEKFDL